MRVSFYGQGGTYVPHSIDKIHNLNQNFKPFFALLAQNKLIDHGHFLSYYIWIALIKSKTFQNLKVYMH